MDKETTGHMVTAVLDHLVGSDEQVGLLAGEVKKQLAPQIEARIEEMSEDLGELRESLKASPPGSGGIDPGNIPPWNAGAYALGVPDANWYNPEADGAALDGKWGSFREFLSTVFRRDLRGINDQRLRNVNETGSARVADELTGEELNLGGALVPEQFRPQLMMMQLQETSIRRRATVLPLQAPSVIIPALRDSDHTGGTVFGGMSFHWLETGATIPDSRPSFRSITLQARSLAALMPIPNTLIADSFVTVPALVSRLYMEGFPWVEEGVFMRGNAVGQPQGVIDSPATVAVSRTAANKFDLFDAVAMLSRLPPGSRGRALWIINGQVEPDLIKMNNANVQAWQPNLAAALPGTLLGVPYAISEHASGRGAKGDVCLIDWSYYVIGDRQSLSVDASKDSKFSENAIEFRGIERIDGRPWIEEPITPAQRTGTDFTLSPFVVLE